MSVLVAIVADVCFYRQSLVDLLERDDRLTVEWAAATWQEAVAGERRGPNIIVLDPRAADGQRAVGELARAFPAAGIIALGLSEVGDDVVDWAENGIAGYVPREGSLDELRETIVAVSRGELRCSPMVAARLLRRVTSLASDRHGEPPPPKLTSREREIISLIDEGLSNKQIATRLFIEVPTVKNHVHNILEKLQVSRRGEAAARLRSAVGPGRTN